MSPLSVDLIKKLFFYLFCKKGKAKKFLVLNKVFYQNKLNQTVKVLGKKITYQHLTVTEPFILGFESSALVMGFLYVM